MRDMLGRNFTPKSTNLLGLTLDDKSKTEAPYTRGFNSKKNLLNLMMSLRSGVCGITTYLNNCFTLGGVRVRLGRLNSMINTACIQSLDFLVGNGDNNDKEYWYKLLKGGENSLESFETRIRSDNDDLCEEIMVGAPLTPRKRSMSRVSQVDLNQFGVSQSPLTSAFCPDDVDIVLVEKYSDESHVQPVPQTSKSDILLSEVRIKKECNSSLKIDTFAGSKNTTTELPQTSPRSMKNQGYLSLSLGDDRFVDRAIHFLQSTSNIYDQIDLLHYLSSCRPMDFNINEGGNLSHYLEEVYKRAMYNCQWTIVRQAAGLLRKVVNSLTINVTDLLIRQKPITVGYGSKEQFITSPMSPAKLADLIRSSCGCDVREQPLVLEVLTFLGSFIRSNSTVFAGIIRIRIHFFIIAMREEISRMRGCDEAEAIEFLMQVSYSSYLISD